jgi:hypothetical protein
VPLELPHPRASSCSTLARDRDSRPRGLGNRAVRRRRSGEGSPAERDGNEQRGRAPRYRPADPTRTGHRRSVTPRGRTRHLPRAALPTPDEQAPRSRRLPRGSVGGGRPRAAPRSPRRPTSTRAVCDALGLETSPPARTTSATRRKARRARPAPARLKRAVRVARWGATLPLCSTTPPSNR